MLVDVLRRRKWDQKAKTRIIDLDQDQSFVILNKVSDPASWDGPVFCGQLIQTQKGADIHAIMQSLEDDTSEFLLQTLEVSEQAQIVKGAMYFAVVGNHVGLIEGHQVKGRVLERYLTALLQKAGELEPAQAIILNSRFLAGDGKELDEASEITVAAAPSSSPPVAAIAAGEVAAPMIEREAGAARGSGATVLDLLRTLGWGNDAISKLEEDVPEDGWVEGVLRVFIKQRRKKVPIRRATINEALRNIDAADLGLIGDGSEKGGIVKLSVQRLVETNRSLLSSESAMEQIVNALREWALAGKIDCRFEG